MSLNETLIRNVVREVLSEISGHASGQSAGRNGSTGARTLVGRHGVFSCPDEAIAAANKSFDLLSQRPIADRKRIIDHIRRISIDQSVELGTMEMEETKIGRLEHKIDKLRTLGEKTPGVEFLRSEVVSGDHGLAVVEHAA
jgi:aldehyde dehydrogenase